MVHILAISTPMRVIVGYLKDVLLSKPRVSLLGQWEAFQYIVPKNAGSGVRVVLLGFACAALYIYMYITQLFTYLSVNMLTKINST